MPSPFPGMDPFLESQEWSDFHTTYVTVLRELLTPQLRPRYEVKVERRVYIERAFDEPPRNIEPDVSVIRPWNGGNATAVASPSQATLAPVLCALPRSERRREAFLSILSKDSEEVVTVLELLSPGNTRRGSDGRDEYLEKRNEVLDTHTNLVELDLFRGGLRLPMEDSLPPGEFYALVSRAGHPRAEVYAWTLRDPLPEIPIPLARGDADSRLDLQAAFNIVYDRAGYDYMLKYDRSVEPPLDANMIGWVETRLAESRSVKAAQEA